MADAFKAQSCVPDWVYRILVSLLLLSTLFGEFNVGIRVKCWYFQASPKLVDIFFYICRFSLIVLCKRWAWLKARSKNCDMSGSDVNICKQKLCQLQPSNFNHSSQHYLHLGNIFLNFTRLTKDRFGLSGVFLQATHVFHYGCKLLFTLMYLLFTLGGTSYCAYIMYLKCVTEAFRLSAL